MLWRKRWTYNFSLWKELFGQQRHLIGCWWLMVNRAILIRYTTILMAVFTYLSYRLLLKFSTVRNNALIQILLFFRERKSISQIEKHRFAFKRGIPLRHPILKISGLSLATWWIIISFFPSLFLSESVLIISPGVNKGTWECFRVLLSSNKMDTSRIFTFKQFEHWLGFLCVSYCYVFYAEH